MEKKRLISDGAVLSALHMVNDGYLACLPLFLPFISESIAISLSQAGFLGSVLHLSSILLAFPAAFLGARLGSFHTLGYAALFTFLSYILMFFARNYDWILAAFLAGSLGFGVFHPVAFAAVAKTSDSKLGTKMGNFTANGDIGRIALSALLTFLIARISWGNTALVYSFLPLLCGLAILLCGRYRHEAVLADGAARKGKQKIFVIPGKRLALLFAVIFTDGFAVASLFLFLPFLFQSKGFDTAIIGSLTGVFFIGNYLGKMVCGRIVELKGVKKVFLCAEFCLALTVFSLSFVDNMYLLIVLLVVMGILSKGTVPVLSTFLADTAKEMGVNIDGVYSMYSFILGIAETVSPLVLGMVAASFGIGKMFIVCSVISACTVMLGLFLTEPENDK
ncbi:MAG: MFS transporter [Spirochaetia bacterium]|nr:MFS transporter [Spirochaetia bacterium]